MRKADLEIITLKDISTLEKERAQYENKLNTLQAAYDKIKAEKTRARCVETQKLREHVARNTRIAESVDEHVKIKRQQEVSLPHNNANKDGQTSIKEGVVQNERAEIVGHYPFCNYWISADCVGSCSSL